MKVAIYDPESGRAVCIMSSENPLDIACTFARAGRFWGFPSRILDETPYEDQMSIMGLPPLPVFDYGIREGGEEPRSFDPSQYIHS